uniref:Uncharacterized protein n=1 Tax=Anguilla anguilla TaxID=7936 RepID=A0A0E9XWC9_ANGAN
MLIRDSYHYISTCVMFILISPSGYSFSPFSCYSDFFFPENNTCSQIHQVY